MQRVETPIVVQGVCARGRGLGLSLPTATLVPDTMPDAREGVYASRVFLRGKEYKGATSVGVATTVGAKAPSVETHILDYAGKSLVGERLKIELLGYIRPMEAFPSLQALEEAMERDIGEVRSLVY